MDDDYKILLFSKTNKTEIKRAIDSVLKSKMTSDEKNYYIARGYAILNDDKNFKKYFSEINDLDPRKLDLKELFLKSKNDESINLIGRASLGLGTLTLLILLGGLSVK